MDFRVWDEWKAVGSHLTCREELCHSRARRRGATSKPTRAGLRSKGWTLRNVSRQAKGRCFLRERLRKRLKRKRLTRDTSNSSRIYSKRSLRPSDAPNGFRNATSRMHKDNHRDAESSH